MRLASRSHNDIDYESGTFLGAQFTDLMESPQIILRSEPVNEHVASSCIWYLAAIANSNKFVERLQIYKQKEVWQS